MNNLNLNHEEVKNKDKFYNMVDIARELEVPYNIAKVILKQDDIEAAKEDFTYINYVCKLGFCPIGYPKIEYVKNELTYAESERIKDSIKERLGESDCSSLIDNLSHEDLQHLCKYMSNRNYKHEQYVNNLVENKKIKEIVELMDYGHFVSREQIDQSFLNIIKMKDKELFKEFYNSLAQQLNPENQILNRVQIRDFKECESEAAKNIAIDYIFDNSRKLTYKGNDLSGGQKIKGVRMNRVLTIFSTAEEARNEDKSLEMIHEDLDSVVEHGYVKKPWHSYDF